MAAKTVSKSFTAVGAGGSLLVKVGDSFSYSVSGTFVGTVIVERSINGGASWESVVSATGAASGTILAQNPGANAHVDYRFRCSAFTSGTIVTALADVSTAQRDYFGDGDLIFRIGEAGIDTLVRPSQKRLINAGAKVGATSGWLVNAADNKNSLARLPASQTTSTLVVQVSGMKVGDIITGFHLVGQVESVGATVTINAQLRKQSAAAADLTDALVGSMTQLAVTAETILSATNTEKASLSDTVGADETFYVLITGTTAALTDIDLQAVAIEFTEN